MATHAPDALDPLVLATVVGEAGERIVGESHASSSLAHPSLPISRIARKPPI